MSTYSEQGKLPRLPVPTLEQTAEKWLKTIEPFTSAEELSHTKTLLQDFMHPGGVGRYLQQKLIERDQKSKNSWLEEWWNAYAYMDYRDSVVINVSFYFTLCDAPRPVSQAQRAANLVTLALEYKALIDNETLPVERSRNTPQCMVAYSRFFTTCRIPGPETDTWISTPSPQNNTHIIIVSKNRYYSLAVTDTKNNRLYTPSQLSSIFQSLIQESSSLDPAQPSLGVLSADNRTTWFHARQHLIEFSPRNKETLSIIESSAFLLCLDNYAPQSYKEMCNLLLHGGGSSKLTANRFWDKTLQLVVFENSKAGLIGEHSGIDGLPTMHFLEWLLSHEASSSSSSSSSTSNSVQTSNNKPYRLLSLDLSSPQTQTQISRSSEAVNTLLGNLNLEVLHYKNFGKNQIKSWGVSPDAVAQLAMQRAYFKLHSSFPPTYESASTRQFNRGRTETGRVVSNESVNWVKAMALGSGTSRDEKERLFKEAAKAHVKYLKEAGEGYGVDRHWLGLKLLAKQFGKGHGLLDSKAMKESGHWRISSSQLPVERLEGVGYGPVVGDGYGCWYAIKDGLLAFTVTSWRDSKETDAGAFVRSLEQALDEIKVMFESKPKAKKEAKL
eukprot:TRINITY_DN809_c3_g1_i1.p1 TRINITY_DN809_c3_g1~~TRINITY_DN809_c3_g1_i1.p1  ORF type:complete len:611 (-),score=142.33 TRINITY_DN809_c3_g1_i1:20-1852(-)